MYDAGVADVIHLWVWGRDMKAGISLMWRINLGDVGNLISGSSAFSQTIMNIWKFTVHILLKPGLENFEHYFTSV